MKRIGYFRKTKRIGYIRVKKLRGVEEKMADIWVRPRLAEGKKFELKNRKRI
jgi:hypothetical protein